MFIHPFPLRELSTVFSRFSLPQNNKILTINKVKLIINTLNEKLNKTESIINKTKNNEESQTINKIKRLNKSN